MGTINENLNETAARAIVNTRVFCKIREELYNAWIDPAKISKWWGPNGFTNTFHTFNPVEGGKWSFIMHGPDGNDYPNESVFVSLTPNREIILDHISAPKFRLTATFEDAPDGTRLVFNQLFETVEIRDKIAKLVGNANEENLDRLEQVV